VKGKFGLRPHCNGGADAPPIRTDARTCYVICRHCSVCRDDLSNDHFGRSLDLIISASETLVFIERALLFSFFR
jgi:hypothetical protein